MYFYTLSRTPPLYPTQYMYCVYTSHLPADPIMIYMRKYVPLCLYKLYGVVCGTVQYSQLAFIPSPYRKQGRVMIENMGSMDIVLCLGLDVVFTHNTVCQYTIGPVSLSVYTRPLTSQILPYWPTALSNCVYMHERLKI